MGLIYLEIIHSVELYWYILSGSEILIEAPLTGWRLKLSQFPTLFELLSKLVNFIGMSL